MVDFGNSADARSWFQAQPREVAVVMAARAALRILPIGPGHRLYMAQSRAAVVLPYFRAAATAWVAGKFPIHGVALCDAAAANDAAAVAVRATADASRADAEAVRAASPPPAAPP